MTNREKVAALRAKGYDVSYKSRKDGSIRITRISGKGINYKGSTDSSEGNNLASRLLGTKLDQRKLEQRHQAGKIAKEVQQLKKKGKIDSLTNEEKRLIRKAQRQARKIGKSGNISTKQYRERKKREGAQSAQKALKNLVLHLHGFAYKSQVEALLEFANSVPFMKSDWLRWLSSHLRPFINGDLLMLDESLREIYDALYIIGKPTTIDSEREVEWNTIKWIITNNERNSKTLANI